MNRNIPGFIPKGGVIGKFSFDRRRLTECSPTHHIPNHGTHLLATTYAFDFAAVDNDGLMTSAYSTCALFTPEPPESFHASGRPLHSPVVGTVVSVHDGEPGHVTRRSVLTRILYGSSQSQRIRQGFPIIPGDHIIIQVAEGSHCVGLVHLQRGSVQMSPGDWVNAGDQIGRCDNSGSSTRSHPRIQTVDGPDFRAMKGASLRFEEFR